MYRQLAVRSLPSVPGVSRSKCLWLHLPIYLRTVTSCNEMVNREKICKAV